MNYTVFLCIFKRISDLIRFLCKDMKVIFCLDDFLSYNYLKFIFKQNTFFPILPAGKRNLKHL